MNNADRIFKKNLQRILTEGIRDTDYEVRPRWEDGTPAHTKYITHSVNEYNLQEEFPILTLRPVAWRTGLKEIFWIYQDKSNDVTFLEEKYNVNYWREWANKEGNLNKAYGYQAGKKIDFEAFFLYLFYFKETI